MVVGNPLQCSFFYNDTTTTEIYTLSLHDALPISGVADSSVAFTQNAARTLRNTPSTNLSIGGGSGRGNYVTRSEEHTSELQSQSNLVCRLLLEKKKTHLYPITIKLTDKLNKSIMI